MEREACVCDHGFERSDLCAKIIIIIIIIAIATLSYLNYYLLTYVLQTFWRRFFLNLEEKFGKQRFGWKDLHVPQINQLRQVKHWSQRTLPGKIGRGHDEMTEDRWK